MEAGHYSYLLLAGLLVHFAADSSFPLLATAYLPPAAVETHSAAEVAVAEAADWTRSWQTLLVVVVGCPEQSVAAEAAAWKGSLQTLPVAFESVDAFEYSVAPSEERMKSLQTLPAVAPD